MKTTYQPRQKSRHHRPGSAQHGFSLIITLILLVVVTVLGVGASQIALLAEKSTRFARDSQIAFQAAEAALIDAEFDIRGPNTSGNQRVATFVTGRSVAFVDGCGTGSSLGLCLPAAAGQKPVWYTNTVDFTDESSSARTVQFGQFTGRTLSTGSSGIRPEILPRYIIEVIPDLSAGVNAQATLYRVTAMGFGPRKSTQAVVQMIFRKE